MDRGFALDDARDDESIQLEPEPEQLDCQSQSLATYYRSLDPEQIQEDIEMMKVANVRELYQLIAADCTHYISIIEHYREENLQTRFNMSIRRIEGHILVKYRFNANDRWTEVGFFDAENTDQETMKELRTSIEHYLKSYDQSIKDRRQHLVAQLEEVNPPKLEPTTVTDLDYDFDPIRHPELVTSPAQSQSAGYRPVPAHLKQQEATLKNQASLPLNLNDYVNDQHRTPCSKRHQPEVPVDRQLETPVNYAHELLGLGDLVPQHNLELFEAFIERIDQHDKTVQLIQALNQQLHTTPKRYHPYIYSFIWDLTGSMSPSSIVGVLLDSDRT